MRQPEKACPFCGDIDYTKVFHESHEGGNPNRDWSCGCYKARCKVRPIAWGGTRDEAIDNWERRAE
jgi:hypothetical protein